MYTLFASDIHLSAKRPLAVQRFVALLRGAARRADAFYLLGDIFDEWLGDDDARAPHLMVEAEFAALAAAGVPLFFLPGNHDFLVGANFEQRSGCHILNDPSVIQVEGTRVLVGHGDLLCTADVEYQAFRTFSRKPENQRAFLAKPMSERAAEAVMLRERSRASTSLKADDIMDVDQGAVASALTTNACDMLIHGHTHRPTAHEVEIGSRTCLRLVLGDWHDAGDLVGVWYRGEHRPHLLSAAAIRNGREPFAISANE